MREQGASLFADQRCRAQASGSVTACGIPLRLRWLVARRTIAEPMAAAPITRAATSCLVLGGTGYVGSAVCRMLHRQGIRVAFTWCHRHAEAEALAVECQAQAIPWNALGDSAQTLVEDAAFALGGLSGVVQCIGTAGDAQLYRDPTLKPAEKFLNINAAGWAEMLDLTARSSFAVCQAAGRILAANGGGQIVLISSMDGVKAVPAPVHYAAAKGAITAMTQAMAKALGPSGILVNAVAPGILSGGIGALLSDQLKADYLRHCALKRLGTADEVADLVAWLLCENTYVTGQTLLLDGGL